MSRKVHGYCNVTQSTRLNYNVAQSAKSTVITVQCKVHGYHSVSQNARLLQCNVKYRLGSKEYFLLFSDVGLTYLGKLSTSCKAQSMYVIYSELRLCPQVWPISGAQFCCCCCCCCCCLLLFSSSLIYSC